MAAARAAAGAQGGSRRLVCAHPGRQLVLLEASSGFHRGHVRANQGSVTLAHVPCGDAALPVLIALVLVFDLSAGALLRRT
jgi:hypothetical protein